MKFVNHARHGIIIFGDHIEHKTMADFLGSREEITSAGFVNLADPELIQCSGRSQTLGVSSDQRDTSMLRMMFGF